MNMFEMDAIYLILEILELNIRQFVVKDGKNIDSN